MAIETNTATVSESGHLSQSPCHSKFPLNHTPAMGAERIPKLAYFKLANMKILHLSFQT